MASISCWRVSSPSAQSLVAMSTADWGIVGPGLGDRRGNDSRCCSPSSACWARPRCTPTARTGSPDCWRRSAATRSRILAARVLAGAAIILMMLRAAADHGAWRSCTSRSVPLALYRAYDRRGLHDGRPDGFRLLLRRAADGLDGGQGDPRPQRALRHAACCAACGRQGLRAPAIVLLLLLCIAVVAARVVSLHIRLVVGVGYENAKIQCSECSGDGRSRSCS